jgi:hypothetical protein
LSTAVENLLSPFGQAHVVHDFKIFLSKVSGKTPDGILSAADEEMRGVFASPKKQSGAFAYLLGLRLLTSYIHLPPQPQDRRGPAPERIMQALRTMGLLRA